MASTEVTPRPRLRSLESFPVRFEGRDYVCLRDPQNLGGPPVLLNQRQVFLVAHMDGEHTLRDIQLNFARAAGEILPVSQIEEVVRQLDECGFLESVSFQHRLAGLQAEFRALPARPALHAGGAYPADPQELLGAIEGHFGHPDGPGAADAGLTRPPRGLVAPHIDFERGGPAYAHAYAALRGSTATRFIIFGTAHQPMARRFALTMKSFETPLGTAETDKHFVEGLAARLGPGYFDDEFAHRGEHSIEFQAVYLRYLFGRRRDFSIVPILVGSFHDFLVGGRSPGLDIEVGRFVEAVRATLAKLPAETCMIAGADLAHVGRRFGDASGPTAALLRTVESEDRAFLERVAAGDAEGVYRSIAEDGDRRRVCGYPPTYMALRCMDAPAGKVLHYRQWSDSQSAVTFAAVAVQ